MDSLPEVLEAVTSERISSFIFSPETITSSTIDDIVFQINYAYRQLSRGDAVVKAYLLYPDQKVQRIKSTGELWVGGSLAFNSKSENTERALMFLDWIHQNQANYDLFMYGIECRDYIIQNSQYDFPENMNNINDAYVGWAGRSIFSDLSFERYPLGYPENSKQEYSNFILEKTAFAPTDGFIPAITSHFNDRAFLDDFERPMAYGTFDPGKKIDNGGNLAIK